MNLESHVEGKIKCQLFITFLLHFGLSPFQLPDAWQVLELEPDNVYPDLHEKEATVL